MYQYTAQHNEPACGSHFRTEVYFPVLLEYSRLRMGSFLRLRASLKAGVSVPEN